MTGITGYGATFGIEGATPGQYTTVGSVRNISALEFSRTAIQTTSLTATGQWNTYIPGMKDGGTVTITVARTPVAAASDVLFQAFEAGVDKFRIALGGINHDFSATPTAYNMGEIQADGLLESQLTLQLSGAPTIAAAS